MGRDTANSYRTAEPTIPMDSDLEEDEDGLHIDFDAVTKTLLEVRAAFANDEECARSAALKEAPCVANGGSGNQRQKNPVFLDNHLLIEGHAHEQLDESMEILASSLPESRQNAEEYQNLILCSVACGWKCPVNSCNYTVHPRSGKQHGKEEHDKVS